MSKNERSLSVCISPAMAENYPATGRLAVIVDILRATSCWVTAFSHGAKAIHPVNSLEECRSLMNAGYIGAAERQGDKVEGFDLGNSPFEYMNNVEDRKIAVTTTNGTRTVNAFRKHKEVVIGSFLNFAALVEYIRIAEEDVLLACAGWEGGISLEDVLFTGAVIERISDRFVLDDSTFMALRLWENSQLDFRHWLLQTSHVKRLMKLGFVKDVDYCFTYDLADIVPRLEGNQIINPADSK